MIGAQFGLVAAIEMWHQTDDIAVGVHDAGDVIERAVGIRFFGQLALGVE